MPRFVVATTAAHTSFLTAMDELAGEGRTGDDSMVGHDLAAWGGRWHDPDSFAAYVEQVRAEATDEPAPGRVACTTLWWVEGVEWLGRLSIRHDLIPRLEEVGGHIGYDVRPSRRREGHATRMLAEALPIARGLGIDRALVTCDHDNVASRRTIERNGGVLADRRGVKLRFWIDTVG